jgi:hypothetical protein
VPAGRRNGVDVPGSDLHAVTATPEQVGISGALIRCDATNPGEAGGPMPAWKVPSHALFVSLHADETEGEESEPIDSLAPSIRQCQSLLHPVVSDSSFHIPAASFHFTPNQDGFKAHDPQQGRSVETPRSANFCTGAPASRTLLGCGWGFANHRQGHGGHGWLARCLAADCAEAMYCGTSRRLDSAA